MSTTTNIAFRFLSELDSKSTGETIDSLKMLIEHLEEKNDPNPFEVQIFNIANQTLEKLKTLEGLLKNYVSESNEIHKGNKLQKLYETTKIDGSHIMFD